VRITMAQTDVTLGDVDSNLKTVERVVGEAVEADSDLIVFPELALSGYQVGQVSHDLSLAPDDRRLLRISQRAGGAGVLLGYPEAGGHGLHTYNSAGYYEDGRLVHVHRKLYLPTYSSFEERKHFLPGQQSRAGWADGVDGVDRVERSERARLTARCLIAPGGPCARRGSRRTLRRG